MIELQEIFDIKYGHGLSLNKLNKKPQGVNFVSRQSKNNGVSAKVNILPEIEPYESGMITVALGGSVLESFVQPAQFYTAYHIFCLSEKETLTLAQKLYYCACIRANKYRYSFGRQANKTLKTLFIPSINEIPTWVNNFDIASLDNAHHPFSKEAFPVLDTKKWMWFIYEDLFEVKKGKRLTKSNMIKGTTPFIGSIDSNNGVSHYIGQAPIFKENTITINYDGSVAEAYYQPKPYWALDSVNVLYPKFKLNPYIGMFLVTLFRKEKYRFTYGRKWRRELMKKSKIKLPVDNSGNPDWQFMENCIKTLPYSSSL